MRIQKMPFAKPTRTFPLVGTLAILGALCANTVLASNAIPPGGEILPSAAQLLQKLQEHQTFTSDVQSKVQLTQQRAGQGTRILEMEYYRRDRDDAFLIVMTAPEAERGNGYLRVGENFWMYRRNTRTFQHVNRDESIGGTDARGDDFENRKLTEIFEGARDSAGLEKVRAETLGKIPVYRVEVQAVVSDVDYPRKIFWVRRDNFLLLKEEAYTRTGTHMQTGYYHQYTQIQGRFVPIKQMFLDEFEKGNRTVVDLTDIRTQKLADHYFTKAYLENLSR